MAVWWFNLITTAACHRDDDGVQHRILRSGSTSGTQQGNGLPLSGSAAAFLLHGPFARTAATRSPKTSSALLLHAHCIVPPKIEDNRQSLLSSTFLLLPLEETTASANKPNTNRTQSRLLLIAIRYDTNMQHDKAFQSGDKPSLYSQTNSLVARSVCPRRTVHA